MKKHLNGGFAVYDPLQNHNYLLSSDVCHLDLYQRPRLLFTVLSDSSRVADSYCMQGYSISGDEWKLST